MNKGEYLPAARRQERESLKQKPYIHFFLKSLPISHSLAF
jgi:hypothetical protein